MRAYAESGFILRLITADTDSETAVSEYRRRGKPPLFYLPLHSLEVRNAILQRAFHSRHSVPPPERRQILQERDAALSRLDRLVARRTLLDTTLDMDTALARAAGISQAHTELLGARAIDVLHVASALLLESEVFLTTDVRQAHIAKAEGLLRPNL